MGLVASKHVEPSLTRIEPVTAALAGGFLTIGPSGDAFTHLFNNIDGASVLSAPILLGSRGCHNNLCELYKDFVADGSRQ